MNRKKFSISTTILFALLLLFIFPSLAQVNTEFNMRGVVVVGLRENAIAWARLYMEPVQSLSR